MKHLADIFEGILDSDFDVVPSVHSLYEIAADFNFQYIKTITGPIRSEVFDKVERIIPRDNFGIDTETFIPPFNSDHPGRYLIKWLYSQPMDIVGDDKKTEQLFYRWIPKSKRLRVVWKKSGGDWSCIFYYTAGSDNYGIIQLNLFRRP